MNEVIRYYYSKGKNKYDVGIIAVVHTFGKDIKWNPHVHALITEGGINKNTILERILLVAKDVILKWSYIGYVRIVL